MVDVPRRKWGARAPKHVTPLAASRTKGVGGHYNGPALNIANHDDCYAVMRNTQRDHMDGNGWADYAYSFAVCPHGTSFEGRGWGARTAANGTNHGNANYHAIKCLVGEGEPLTDAMLAAFNKVLASKPAGGKAVVPHRVFKPTKCPGEPLTAWINSGRGGPAPVPPSPGLGSRALRKGMSGGDVRGWQQRMLNYYGGTKPKVDGQFGPETHAYTMETQKRAGVTRDGIVGPQTLAGMARLEKAKADRQPAAPKPDRLLKTGVRGEDVREWQQRMKDYYGGNDPSVDGVFGPETHAYTAETQKRAKVVIDGIVGPQTLQGMARLEQAKKDRQAPKEPPVSHANAVVYDPSGPSAHRLLEKRLALAVGAYQDWPVLTVSNVEGGVHIGHLYAVGHAHESGEGLAVDAYTQLAGGDLNATVDAVLGWMADNRPGS